MSVSLLLRFVIARYANRCTDKERHSRFSDRDTLLGTRVYSMTLTNGMSERLVDAQL